MSEQESPGRLTPRELEIVRLLIDTPRYEDIASKLRISIYTLRTHITHIHEKLGVHSKTELACKAIKLGLVNL